MVVGAMAADHPGMTTEQPTAPRLLRRRGDDRVLGGVASGLADYFNVDPLLVRIGFVGLMVFNGLGLGLYLLAWLLVPTDTDNQSVVQRIIGRSIVRREAVDALALDREFLRQPLDLGRLTRTAYQQVEHQKYDETKQQHRHHQQQLTLLQI